MTSFSRIILICLSVAALILPSCFALAADLNENASALNESVDALLEIKDDSALSETERGLKEIDARKKVIVEAVRLSVAEINGLKENLSKNKPAEAELKLKAASFFSYLDEAAAYFESAGIKAGELTDLEEIKALANELKDYRENNYNPRLQKIVDFFLWLQIDNLISAAETRWQKINLEIKKFEKYELIDPGVFSADMENAQKYLAGAKEISQEAGKMIIETNLDELNPPLSDADAIEKLSAEPAIKPSARELLGNSLKNLRSSYEIFVKISRDAIKILQP
jgi:hypothetical protein